MILTEKFEVKVDANQQKSLSGLQFLRQSCINEFHNVLYIWG